MPTSCPEEHFATIFYRAARGWVSVSGAVLRTGIAAIVTAMFVGTFGMLGIRFSGTTDQSPTAPSAEMLEPTPPSELARTHLERRRRAMVLGVFGWSALVSSVRTHDEGDFLSILVRSKH